MSKHVCQVRKRKDCFRTSWAEKFLWETHCCKSFPTSNQLNYMRSPWKTFLQHVVWCAQGPLAVVSVVPTQHCHYSQPKCCKGPWSTFILIWRLMN